MSATERAIRWPKVISGVAIAAVAGVAGVISYTHIYRLTLALHQPVMVAKLMPFGVDGLIVVGSVVLLQALEEMPWLGWLGVGPGVVISVFANVESGIRYGILPAIWAGVPAVSFFLATFILERWLKAQAGKSANSAGLARLDGPVIPAPEGAPADAPKRTVRTALKRTRPAAPKTNPEVHFAAALASGEMPSVRRIRSELHVGQPKAQQIHATLAAAMNGTAPAEQ